MNKFKSILCTATIATLLSLNVMAANIKIAYDSDPVSLDPHEQLSAGVLQMSHMIFDPLVRFDKNLNFKPRLATEWKQVDENTLRMKLRDDVSFHSGNPLTADDVVWTFARVQTSADFKGVFAPISEIKKVDDYTIDVITKDPYPLVLQVMTYMFPMDSKHYTGTTEDGKEKAVIIKHQNSFASTNPSGTGPFTVASRQQGVELKYSRNENYWDKDSRGNVDNITLVPIAENATRVAALLSGDIDFIYPVAPNDLDAVRKAKNIDLYTLGGTRVITFQMNQNSQEAFKDIRVRQAIVHAVNNEAIVKKIMKGFATVTAQNSPKGYLGYDESLKPRFDLKKAKELMKEAGYEDGLEITMYAPNNRYVNDEKIAQAIAGMLAKINIKVDLKTLPKAQYWPEFDVCAADMMMIGWHSDTEDSANMTEFLLQTRNAETGAGQYNCGYYSNAKVDDLLMQSNKEMDMEKRRAMLQEIETIQYEDAAFVPLHFQNLAWGASEKLENVDEIINPMNFPYLGDLVVKE